MPLTFVTALIDLQGPLKRENHKEELFTNFKKIAETDIPIHLFLSSSFQSDYNSSIGSLSNVKITPLELNDLELYKQISNLELNLPLNRCIKKDTRNFMILMNAKAELLHKSIKENPFGTTHFAWIDFGIGYIFKDWERIRAQLIYLSTAKYKETCIVCPGCWNTGRDKDNLFVRINWRFCGGFFLGDKQSIEAFYVLYLNHFRDILKKQNCITWEVNIWHLFELEYDWKVLWYSADHNESIVFPNRECFIDS